MICFFNPFLLTWFHWKASWCNLEINCFGILFHRLCQYGASANISIACIMFLRMLFLIMFANKYVFVGWFSPSFVSLILMTVLIDLISLKAVIEHSMIWIFPIRLWWISHLGAVLLVFLCSAFLQLWLCSIVGWWFVEGLERTKMGEFFRAYQCHKSAPPLGTSINCDAFG